MDHAAPTQGVTPRDAPRTLQLMNNSYKVKLITFPSIYTGMIGLSATINFGTRRITSTAPAKFGSLRELRNACQKASVPVLRSSMPSPHLEHELTLAQLDTLGFHLAQA